MCHNIEIAINIVSKDDNLELKEINEMALGAFSGFQKGDKFKSKSGMLSRQWSTWTQTVFIADRNEYEKVAIKFANTLIEYGAPISRLKTRSSARVFIRISIDTEFIGSIELCHFFQLVQMEIIDDIIFTVC